MKKNTIKIFNILLIPFKICLVFAISYGIYDYFNDVFLHDDVDYGHSYKSLPENSMDVIVLGSSHAQYSFNPGFFYDDTGLHSYVLGSACQPLEVSYEMLKEALKTQTPQMVILEVYTSMPLRSICEADSSYVIAQYQMTGQEKYNTIDYLEEEKAKTYYNDFLSLHNNWKYVDSIEDISPNIAISGDFNKLSETLGFISLEQTKLDNHWLPATYESSIDVELDKLDFESLNNIYKLCQENGIELFLYKTPTDNTSVENQSYLYKVWEWADENNINYLDFYQLAKELDFMMWLQSDSYHAYINGAEIITTKIGESINENYQLNNDTKVSEELNEVYDSLGNNSIRQYAMFEVDPYKYLDRFKTYDDIMILKYTTSEYQPSDWLTNQIKDVVNDDSISLDEDLYIIMNEGKIIEVSNDDLVMEINGNKIEIKENEILINEEIQETKGLFSIILINQNFDIKVTKNIEYRGYTWEYGYDYYNYVG